MTGANDSDLFALEEGRLLYQYRATIKRSVQKVLALAPSHVEFEDLVQTGSLALLMALRRGRYLGRGDNLDRHLRQQIWASLRDEIRRESAVDPGRARSPSRSKRANGQPDVQTFTALQRVKTRKRKGPPERLIESSFAAPEQSVEARQVWSLTLTALERLPNSERRVLELHYLSDAPLREIGAILGVTEGRVSQLHHSALAKLKARLRRFVI